MDIKETIKRREIAIPLFFICLGIIAALIWWIFTYGTVRTDNAKVDADILYITSDTAGILVDFSVSEYNRVSIGETIAEIDPLIGSTERIKNEENLEAFSTLSEIKQQMDTLENKVSLAEKSYRRNKTLFDSGGISKMKLDDEWTTLSVLKSQLFASKNLYDMAKNILNITEADTPYIPLRSPIDGYLARKLVSSGELVVQGKPVFAVVDLSKIWITARIDEDDIADIKKGQPVKVKIDSYSGEKFWGEVSDIGVAASSVFSIIPQDNASGNYIKVTQTIPIKITVDPRGFVFRPGSNAAVTVYAKR
ncbi:MAG: HlyD family secretion protein [Deltaproteobacteria bacterium]|uniref:HlyD family secretion protein n=1 Tax=Candidatus Zymogenus saltonus TaxID=2844893 RepID=A0A9D8PN76_9DELT|nr:HlyD family secretion protein [Candidatus Zymogenus saltonus]